MTRFPIHRISLLALAACLSSFVHATDNAGTARSLQELWNDPAVFLPEFFPERGDLSLEEILIDGLEARFPNRVYREEPALSSGPEREPRVETLMPGVVYLRIYHLGAALPALRERIDGHTLVIDLRNVQAGREDVLEFGRIVTVNETVRISLTEHSGPENSGTGEREIPIETAGLRRPLQPVFVLTNRETAGPLEVLLAELKNKGQIVSIGTPTSGRTGRFRQVRDDPAMYVLSGELRPASGESLLDTGFVPSVTVDVTPEADRKAYDALENGESLETLLATETSDDRETDPPDLGDLLDDDGNGDGGPEADEGDEDVILQRAYHIVTALRSIGKIAAPEAE